MADEKKLLEQSVPGMNRGARFADVEYAENIVGTLRRIVTYFIKEKVLVITMLAIVVFGTLCTEI